MIATEWHGVARTTFVNIREAPMQKTTNKMMIATEWHGVTRNNIRENP